MSDQIISKSGLIILFCSGEPSPTARKVFERVFRCVRNSLRIVLLETPADFELQLDHSLGQVREYYYQWLYNFSIRVKNITYRMLRTLFNPDVPQIEIIFSDNQIINKISIADQI
jgi:hypothetical protein